MFDIFRKRVKQKGRTPNKATTMCPHCGKEVEVLIVTRPEEYNIENISIEINVEYSLCTDCGGDFATIDQMSEALKKGYRILEEIKIKQVVVEWK